MYNILKHAHSGLRWIVLLLLVVAIINALRKWLGNQPFQQGDQKLNMFTMISAHTQLLIGIVLFFISPKVIMSGEAMKNAINRFFLVEHPSMMILALVLITIGYGRSKRGTSSEKRFKTTFWFYLIALILILVGIPYPFQSYGAAWF